MWPLQHVSRTVELSFPRGTTHDVAVVAGLGIGPEKEQDAGAGIWTVIGTGLDGCLRYAG